MGDAEPKDSDSLRWQGGLENNAWEFCIKDFILKPPVQFFKGLDYITLAAR